jgi:hypothetical protein
MDLRSYYMKVREVEAQLKGEHLVVVSLATPEGGKEGVRTEVQRKLAAQMIAEGRARLATDEETEEFHQAHADAKRQQELDEAARRVQVVVIPQQDLPKQTAAPKQKDRG